MSKHTPEPWRQGGSESDAVSKFAHASQVVGELSGSSYILASFNFNFSELAIANAGRAVACVNAMAGIPDPAAFVERAKRMEDALVNIREYWNGSANERAMQDACEHARDLADKALETNP